MNVVTQEDRSKVKEYFNEALKAHLRKNDEMAHIRDIFKTLKEQHDIEPKVARKIVMAMKNGNMPELKEENDAFEDLYEIIS